MIDRNLISERQALQKIKTSILIKAEEGENEFKSGNVPYKYVRHCYLRAAALEVEITEMLKQEGKDSKIHPGVISAISCYLKAEDYSNAVKLLKEYYPKGDSKYSDVEIIDELRKGVEELFRKQDLKGAQSDLKVLPFPLFGNKKAAA